MFPFVASILLLVVVVVGDGEQKQLQSEARGLIAAMEPWGGEEFYLWIAFTSSMSAADAACGH